jgi:dihydropteroate synthase
LESLSFRLTELSANTLQDLVTTGTRLGLDIVTGPDWALLSGTRARLSALARPWVMPESLTEIAIALGHALPGEEPTLWQTCRGPIALDRPVIMGILNVTPDSFSDGGRFDELSRALARAEQLVAEGAAILDIGGESTRPESTPIPEDEEIRRVLPVFEKLRDRLPDTLLSIDTTRSTVARAALDRGAAIVNDVSGLRLDPRLAELAGERKAGLVLMHSRGGPGTLASNQHADYPDGVLPTVIRELAQSLDRAGTAAVPPSNIVVDPGLGFGKTPEQSIELLRGLATIRSLGKPILIGPSRKRFLGAITGKPVADRDRATAAACALGWIAGARIFRVHEPAAVRDALMVASATVGR